MRQRLSQFKRLADYALVERDKRYIVFGRGVHDSVIVSGRHREKLKASKIVKLNATATSLSASDKSRVFEEAKQFLRFDAGPVVATFSILPHAQKAIRETAKETVSSHVEFSCCDGRADAFMFDVRSHQSSVLWNSAYTSKAEGVRLADVRGGNCSFSMKSATFVKLPNETYSVSLYEHYAIFSSANDGVKIYIRDQDLRRPYQTFFSDRLGRPITFLFHAKS